MKNKKTIAVLFSLIILLVCVMFNCSLSEKLERGRVETTLKKETITNDLCVVGQKLPPDAKNRIYLGNGWFTFELNGYKFLYGDKGRASVLTIIDKIKNKKAK